MPWHEYRTGPGTWCIIEPDPVEMQQHQLTGGPAPLAGILWITQAGDYCGFQPAHPVIDPAPFDELVANSSSPTEAYELARQRWANGSAERHGILDTWQPT